VRKMILLLLAITLSFGMELWKQRYELDKQLFNKQLSIIKKEPFQKERFDFFEKTASDLGVLDELKSAIEANNLDSFLKSKAKLVVKLESNAYNKKLFDLIDMQDFERNIEKEILFAKKIKKLFVSLEKSNLAVSTKPLEELYMLKEYLQAIGKEVNNSLFERLESAIKQKDSKLFQNKLKELQKVILLLKSPKLSQEELEANVKSFLRYNKLTSFDYTNGIDEEGNIKNNLEYTEAVIFSARAKEKILTISGNISQENLKKFLQIYKKVINDIQNKRGKKEVRTLTKEAKKIVLQATNLKEVRETPKEIISHINSSLDSMMQVAKKGNFKQADFFRLEAYSFFDPDIETRLQPRDPALSAKLEGLFWDGYGSTKGLGYLIVNKDTLTLQKSIDELNRNLKEAQKVLETKLSFTASIVQSMMIIIREGLEAVLVLAVLLTLFNSRRSKLYLFGGATLGILASIGTYYAAKEILEISTSNRELIEGGSALLAAIMLIFVTAWIFHNTYVKGWVAYAKELAEKSLKNGAVLTLLIVGFLVVYREGFETVLFYEALAQDSYQKAVWIGFWIGLAIIVVISTLLVKGIKKLPIHLFFSITGLLLSILAIIFTGAGIRGLQTANLVSATPSPYLPNWQFLRDYFGYSPTIETTLAQLTIALLLLGFYIYSKIKAKK